ncbi:MAG: cation-translocating P-type ATPase [Burkholderiaceae bacterium]
MLTPVLLQAIPQIDQPSKSSRNSNDAGAVDAIGDPALWDCQEDWLEFSRRSSGEGGVWESSLLIDGMHCSGCALRVEALLRGVPGVLGADVNALSHRAQVRWRESAVVPSTWLLALQRAGYGVQFRLDQQDTERARTQSRLALWRWLVAGLCMMQIMMYAAPAYLAEPGDITLDLQKLLRWASWVLSLPLVLFSCTPFFRQAWLELRLGRISMDLPVSLGVLITFMVSSAGTFDPQGIFGREVYFDSLAMFVFFLLTGRWLEQRLRDRTAGALDLLLNRLPDTTQRLNSAGHFESVRVRRLQQGDVIRVRAGEAFCVDGEVLLGRTLVDEAFLTGESVPLERGPGSQVIAGSYNLSATLQVRVVRLGPDTRFAQIVALMERATLDKPHWAQLADRLARPFLAFVLLAAAAAGAYWWPQSPQQAMMVAVAVLIVTCPCALSLATPTAMLAAAGALARRGVLVRRLQALETLASVDLMVFDKTGTLTCDAFLLTDVQLSPNMTRGSALELAATLAQHSLHPLSRALVRAGGPGCCEAREVQETIGQGVSGWLENVQGGGSPNRFHLGSAAFCGVPEATGAGLQVHLASDFGWLATFLFQEELRPDAAPTLKTLLDQGLQLQLLSGDSPQAVAALARQLGLSPKQLQFLGGCSPDDKLDFLQAAQKLGHTVAMVGDGLNDGPVLASAHVSFAMGQAAPLAQGRSDFVLPTDSLAAVLQTWQLARRTVRVVRQNLIWAAAYNLVCIPLAVVGWLPAWAAGLGMAASSLLVLLNALRLSVDSSEVA